MYWNTIGNSCSLHPPTPISEVHLRTISNAFCNSKNLIFVWICLGKTCTETQSVIRVVLTIWYLKSLDHKFISELFRTPFANPKSKLLWNLFRLNLYWNTIGISCSLTSRDVTDPIYCPVVNFQCISNAFFKSKIYI